MRRRRETQKRGPRGSGARSAPARRGARSHRRRLGSGRQTFARLALRECPGPTPPAFFPPPHFLARLPPAALGVPPRPLPAPSRRLPLRDFVATKRRGYAPNKRTRLQAAPPRAARRSRWMGGGRLAPLGLEGRRAGVTDRAAQPRPPPPPTQLTCHPRPRYSGQRDSGRKSHSGSPLIGPVRASAPSLRGGSAGLDWTPALSVRPRGRAFPPTPGAGEGLRGQSCRLAPGCAHVECGWMGRGRGARAREVGCAGDVSRLAAGRGTVRTCVSAASGQMRQTPGIATPSA
ncbi:caskin-1-like [Leopardus geoffroyi]|uniref:caskin-1-like n=1 Tax=Leopardus geoffroyi TaxID=46844 RepID=UPI001E25FA01|nr:caskin-1-like [Leopardus geoffroyi]